jgi:hypothetical protein
MPVYRPLLELFIGDQVVLVGGMIVIHIGLRKTGSTSIQKFLSVNEETLRAMGVDYSPVGQGKRNNHINLFYEIRNHRNFDSKFGTLAKLVAYRKSSSHKALVLSSEDFEVFRPQELVRFAEALKPLGEDVRIVMVIRDMIDMVPSEYSQKIRNGLNTSDFDSFFDQRMGQPSLPFVEVAELWASTFGWDSLRIRLLDRRHLVNGDLADDFLAITDIDPLGVDAQRLQRPGIANASPGWRVQEAVRALYDGGHGLPATHALGALEERDQEQRKIIGRCSRRLGEKRGWNADRGRYLTLGQAQRCLEMQRASIAALNVNLSTRLPDPLDLEARGFVEREFMPAAAQIPAADLRAFYDELAILSDR